MKPTGPCSVGQILIFEGDRYECTQSIEWRESVSTEAKYWPPHANRPFWDGITVGVCVVVIWFAICAAVLKIIDRDFNN